MKKILFVARHFPPSDSVGSLRIINFIRYLHSLGWDIYVLTLSVKYSKGRANNYTQSLPEGITIFRTNKLNFFGLWDFLKKYIFRRKTPQNKNSRNKIYNKKTNDILRNKSIWFEIKEFISNMLKYPDFDNGWIPYIFFKTFFILWKYKIKFVFVSSPPHSPHIPINLLRKINKFNYVADFRDPWARSQWDNENVYFYQRFQKRLDLFFEKQTIHLADIIIFNTDYLKRDFERFYHQEELGSKAYVLTNGYDEQKRIEVKNEMREKSKKNDEKIVILHTGTIYKRRNPQIIFEGLMKFKKQFPELADKIEIKFIGSFESNFQYLADFISKNSLVNNIFFIPKVPYQEVLTEMMKADWLLLLQPHTTIQIPAKFYDYITVNKPIWAVVEKDSIAQEMVEKLQLGYVTECNSISSVVNFFKQITKNKAEIIKPNEKELINYAISNIASRLDNILQSFLENEKR